MIGMCYRRETDSFQECSCHKQNSERNKGLLGATREEVLGKVGFSWFFLQFVLFISLHY